MVHLGTAMTSVLLGNNMAMARNILVFPYLGVCVPDT